MRELRLGLLVVLAAGLMAACGTLQDTAGIGGSGGVLGEPSHVEAWDGRGTDSERCDKIGEFGRPASGWIHWVFNTKGASTDARLHLGGTGSGEFEPAEPLGAEVWHFFTPFFDLDGLEATIMLYGGDPGSGGGLVISDYCAGEDGGRTLKVTKTAKTKFIRTHDWKIKKSVDPAEMYLYVDGTGDGTATWAIDVLYKGYTDSDFRIYGTITIENVSATATKTITGVTDDLGIEDVDPFDVTCEDGDGVVEFPYDLEAGETITCDYSRDFETKPAASGTNTATVEVDGEDPYEATAEWAFGDPYMEVNETVDVVDVSELFGWVELGTVTAPHGDTFTYDKDFAWQDYGADTCGTFKYPNTAKLKSGGEILKTASALLKVHVQCVQGETAWAANGDDPLENPYNPDDVGNWATYVEYVADKTTTVFAGQTIQVGTAHFSAAVDGWVTITIELSGAAFDPGAAENLKVQDYEEAPSGNPSPGGFDHKRFCDAGDPVCTILVPENAFYGVHLDVLVGDPGFGP
jgi:hypothetical protein